jgi:hypothetical protein
MNNAAMCGEMSGGIGSGASVASHHQIAKEGI